MAQDKPVSCPTGTETVFVYVENRRLEKKMKESKEEKSGMEVIPSDTFYLYHGYHMYLSDYPNGNKAGNIGSLGVFLSTTKGDFHRRAS